MDAVQDAAVWVETGQWAQEDVGLPADSAEAGIDLEAFVDDIETVHDEYRQSFEADSTTQLVAAVDVTDQGVPGDPGAQIQAAVDAGLLHEVYADSESAGRTLRGYVLPGENVDV